MVEKVFYNPETELTETYREVWKLELVKVRDESDLLVRNHYWQDSNDELWVDFDNPMENVYHAFAAYRLKKGYMNPDDIRQLRENLGMSVRSFADVLGIAPSSLTQIENNQRVQAKYQENLFEAVRDKYERDGSLPEGWTIDTDTVNVSYDTRYDAEYNSFVQNVKNRVFDEKIGLGDVA